MPVELGRHLLLLPPLSKVEDSPFSDQMWPLEGNSLAPRLHTSFSGSFWLQPEVPTKEQIQEILMLGQFLTILPGQIQMWVWKQHPGSGEEAVTLWISSIQVPGQEILSEKMESLSHQVGGVKHHPEGDMEQELAMAAAPPPALQEERLIRHQDFQASFLQKEQNWDLMLETYRKTVSGGISNSKSDLTNSAEYGKELAGLHLYVSQKIPRPICIGDRQENDKEKEFWEPAFGQSPSRRTVPIVARGEERDLSETAAEGPHGPETPHLQGVWESVLQEFSACFSPKNSHWRDGETYFQCPTCKKGFLQSSDFMKHRRIHSGEKPCKCDCCGKGFSDFSGLHHHEKIHTGKKPYKCPICEKRVFFFVCVCVCVLRFYLFMRDRERDRDTGRRRSRLLTGSLMWDSIPGSHPELKADAQLLSYPGVPVRRVLFKDETLISIREFTQERKHKCSCCRKSFSWSSSLDKHQRSHLGKKPFP
ncbi:unnamed protein product [Nyctereutes procyonoides]|uniref:(raccoon dog) hypothetical protein n=1 Tax=Nyctereutes procyonoides TaxID=34880 RepID=A0A811ZAJ7_NYCPR|nr:unnamed protein product [Nyctereutes procyonoides]